VEQYSEQNQARPLLWTVLLLLLAQLLSLYFPLSESLRPFVSQSLGVHTLMEGFSIVISALVFAVGWSVYQKENSAGFMMLACCFLGVAVLDLMHTLSFSGMPAFITESDPEKAIAFWLMARAFAALGLVMGLLVPSRQISPVSRSLMLSGVLLYIVLGCWLVFFHQDWLPRTFDAVQGLTSVKKSLRISIGRRLCSQCHRLFTPNPPSTFLRSGWFGGGCRYHGHERVVRDLLCQRDRFIYFARPHL